MTRRKCVCLKWTLVLVLVLCQFVQSRPQDSTTVSSVAADNESSKTTENPIRNEGPKKNEEVKKTESSTSASVTTDTSRNVKTKGPVIGEAIKMVASQLLENQSNTTSDNPAVIDTRISPKVKSQVVQKNKVKRHEDIDDKVENSHAGIAVPITMEELETENKITEINESSTTNEGISTWILLSNPSNKDNVTTEPTKTEETSKKPKPNTSKNKTKKPSVNKVSVGKRPIIGSTNKSDLVASGSAINENVFNKIKDTVLSNVQKNKNSSVSRTTTTTTTSAPTTEAHTTKKEVVKEVTKAPSIPVIKITSKPTKKKNKKPKPTTVTPEINESAVLPMEPKEQEIELEISTPATTTKKPKRSSTKKKNKTKKRKATKPSTEISTAITEIKTTNKTKTNKTKKPSVTSLAAPITSQLYSYFSREVMPSVGVGMLGLASLVGIAGYFLYPFSTPVRRTFEVDKKDDIYRHNAEEYANEGNGQAEEEMLGTVLAGMPAHAKQKLNPYAGQTTHVVHQNRYPVKKEQDIRYRHVANKYEPNYNVHYPQQKTGIAHAAVYSDQVKYSAQRPQYETRHVYTTEGKYTYEKGPAAYTPHSHQSAEPVYAVPQTGPSGVSSYGSDASNSVVYGVKPSSDTDFKPVYPFDGQFYSEVTTNSPMAYPSTSMYLGSNEETETEVENDYSENQHSDNEGDVDNKFVVGNVPKELADSATPAIVPEHGPRNINKRKRSARGKRSVSNNIEQILREEKEKNKDVFISNEIDEVFGAPMQNLVALDEMELPNNNVVPLRADVPTTMDKLEIVESVSTQPIESNQDKTTTDISNDLETTTKTFKVYEVFPSNNPEMSSPVILKTETTTFRNVNTETTTELRSETTSTMPPSPSPITDFKLQTTTQQVTSNPTNNPEVLTYPPLNQDTGFFTFIKRLLEFKYRLGLSILQTTSDNLNRYLRNVEGTAQKVARASST